ncbi:hypothetical protein EXN32_25705 [Agrobacterium tumefaciens]|nr:hypothetical protein EXN32_25705 [Agrobacterium tumefaciens]
MKLNSPSKRLSLKCLAGPGRGVHSNARSVLSGNQHPSFSRQLRCHQECRCHTPVRKIIHVGMDAIYASLEQCENP